MDKRKIKIAGAGIAGLTAAINLAKAGYKVTIYEANSDCGLRFNDDWQGIENWTTKDNAIADLKDMNIGTNFRHIPIQKITWFDSQNNKYESHLQAPLFYLVKRGGRKDSLDQALKKQAISNGVQIEFSKTILLEAADLVATGPVGGKAMAMGFGVNFQTNVEDRVWGTMDNEIAPQGYAYFIVVKGEATVATTIFRDFRNGRKLLEKTIKRFKSLQNFVMNNAKNFSSIGGIGLNLNKKAMGEAAGIQDYLMGFGMRSAMKCGFLGAKSIIEGLDLKKLLIKNVVPLVKSSVLNRKVFKSIGNRGHDILLKKLAQAKDYRLMLYKFYTHDFTGKTTFYSLLKKMTDLKASV